MITCSLPIVVTSILFKKIVLLKVFSPSFYVAFLSLLACMYGHFSVCNLTEWYFIGHPCTIFVKQSFSQSFISCASSFLWQALFIPHIELTSNIWCSTHASLFGKEYDDAMERIGIHFIPEDWWIVERREQATPYIIQELHKIWMSVSKLKCRSFVATHLWF